MRGAHGYKRNEEYRHKCDKRGAKTFRRGRALAFLEMLNVKRSTLKQQLNSPELQTINPVIVGELKAVEMIIDEFTQLFELHEAEQIAEEQIIEEQKNMNRNGE